MEAFEVWSKPTTASPARAEEASRALRRWTKSAFPHVACLPNTATSSHAGKCEADDVPAPPDMEVDDDPWDQRAERQQHAVCGCLTAVGTGCHQAPGARCKVCC